jgi:putative ABC transport system permease protein
MKSLWQDLKYSMRTLTKNPGFAAMAVLMLAIGIGVNSTAFSILDCLLLRPLPVKNPDRLAWINHEKESFSYPEYQDICRQNTSFSGIVACSRHGAGLDRNGETEWIRADWISENFFSVLGIKMALGQAPGPDEEWRGREALPVVISHHLWKTRFASDPAIAGKTIIVSKRNAVICGVAPESFGGLRAGQLVTQVWLPVSLWAGDLNDRKYKDFGLLGRLKDGIEVENTRAELNTIATRLAASYPETNGGVSYHASPMVPDLSDIMKNGTLALGGPFLILIICCANVSGMILSMIEGRQGEMAVRLALGANRNRLLRQLMTETFVLVIAGAGLGLLLTSWLIGLQEALMPPMQQMRFDFRMDWRVLVFTLVTCVGAALISGLAPALHAVKRIMIPALKKGASASQALRRINLRNCLVTGEIALSLLLLAVTGIFLKSLIVSKQIDPGFDPGKNLLIVMTRPSYEGEKIQRFYRPAIEQIKSLPGVRNASYAMRMPLSGSGGGSVCNVLIPGMEPPKGRTHFEIKYGWVGPDYFGTVGTRILRGRGFDNFEDLSSQSVTIINETMAERFWPGVDPIGRSIMAFGRNYQIIGVTQNVKINGIHESPQPYLFFPASQVYMGDSSIVVETSGNPLSLAGAVKNKIRAVDKFAQIYRTEASEDLMNGALYQDHIAAVVSGALGILGIILTAAGLYGILAYLAMRRTQEIGIRIALGATRQNISQLIVRQGFRISLTGIAIGLILSCMAMRLFASYVYGGAPIDLTILVGSCLAVIAVALLAGYIPAHRASRVDPIKALRYE